MIDNVIPRTAVVKRAARIGAEISNLKLSGALPDQTIAAIKGLLLDHKVFFFCDQGHLDDAEHERFALCLGKLVLCPPLSPMKGTMWMLEIDYSRGARQTDTWDVDCAYMDAYPKILVLRGRAKIRAPSPRACRRHN